jgi:nucleotide-binding universal stress UspA family protein
MYRKILIALDGSGCSERAARAGLYLADQLDSSVVLVNVVDSWPTRYGSNAPGWEEAKQQGQALLARWEQTAYRMGLKVQTQLQELAAPADGIVTAANQVGCDLIVMGTHSRSGLEHWLLGSVAERVTRLAPVPVLLIRGQGGAEPAFSRILVPIDGSPLSNLALDYAKKLVGFLGGQLWVLHVEPQIPLVIEALEEAPDDQAQYHQAVQTLLDRAVQDFPNAQAILRQAGRERVGDVIAQVAQEKSIDLVVMGTHGYTGLDHWLLGSVAERVTHQAKAAVLLVRQQSHSSLNAEQLQGEQYVTH